MQQHYLDAGERRAFELDNRGPIKFDANGMLSQDILDAYWRAGFYVFEGLVDAAEIELLRSEMNVLLDRAPVNNESMIDRLGRPSFGQEFARPVYF